MIVIILLTILIVLVIIKNKNQYTVYENTDEIETITIENNKGKNIKIAIVLDDTGKGINQVKPFIESGINLTFAIIPNLKMAGNVSSFLSGLGYETIIHLPMEPRDYKKRNIPLMNNTVIITMSGNEIEKIIDNAYNIIPNAKGLNNHQGSKATADKKTMQFVINCLKDRELFFIDSYTHKSSIGFKIAREEGIPYYKRDIFLDNKDNEEYISEQFNKLIKTAKKKGHALGIGHVTSMNLSKVIKVYKDIFKQENIKIVFASELIEISNEKEIIVP